MRSLLDHMADGIEYTLHSHGIEAGVVGGNISPRLIQFHIQAEGEFKPNRLMALADEFAAALNVSHCRISRQGYLFKVEVPRPNPVAVELFPLMRNLPSNLPSNAPVLGLDENGVPLLLKLNSPDIAHIFIYGASGSGKTGLIRSMVASLALQNSAESLRLLLIDPKGKGYSHFSGLPNLACPVITDALDGIHRLKWAVRHMEKRLEQGVSTPTLVILIDNLDELAIPGGPELEQTLVQLVENGAPAGIHVVAGMRKLNPTMAAVAACSWPVRVVGRVATAEEARIAARTPNSGAERLLGQGDFLLFTKSEAARLQAAFISPAEMEQTVKHLAGEPEIEAKAGDTRQEVQKSSGLRRENNETDYGDGQHAAARSSYSSRTKDRRGKSRASQVERDSTEAEGVAERLERYRESIQQRRRQGLKAEETETATEYPYYNPLRNRRQNQESQPSRANKRSGQESSFEEERKSFLSEVSLQNFEIAGTDGSDERVPRFLRKERNSSTISKISS